MPKDKYSAVWVSHSSIRDFLTCPRAYYLNNIYKDPVTGHKIQLISPPLSLGQAVHQVLESLSVLPVEKRFSVSLVERFEKAWKQVSGKKGGFFDQETENKYKTRGSKMMQRVMNNPGPIEKLAVKIKQELPYYWLSQEENIILCGKIDWLEYLPDDDAVHIIDFKTGKKKEDDDSLQLPIYLLLVHNVQKRAVSQASYWYLETDNNLIKQPLPDLKKAQEQVLQVAKKIKLARQLEHFKCPQGEKGCFACKPLEKIIKGEAIKVGESEYNQDLYVIKDHTDFEDNSVII
jgi:ATP-dependent helicase/DNAse subunit B